MNWLINIQTLENDLQLNFRGSIDIKAFSTNESLRYWDINMSTDFSKYIKDLKLELTRKTKGDKNLMVLFT
jgi:hypothetical protein